MDSKDNEQFGPLLIGGPKKNEDAAPIIDLKAAGATAHDQINHDEIHRDEFDTDVDEDLATHFVPPPRVKIDWHWPLAAGVVVAAAIGAMAGAGTTATLMRGDTSTNVAASANVKTLGDSVAQLNTELATLKTAIASGQRNTGSQFGKLAERLDRSEKAQEKALADPVGKLAKLQDSVDRLEKRQQQAAAAADNDITGSITKKETKELKEEPKPLIAQGWHLRDYSDGRAIVENRNGTLFRVGTGSSLPGLGKVESIKRDSGRITVVTTGGIITAMIEYSRRMPPQYYRW